MKKTITCLMFAKRPPSCSITTRYKHAHACLEGEKRHCTPTLKPLFPAVGWRDHHHAALMSQALNALREQ